MRLELSEVLACPVCGPPQVMVAVVGESVGNRVIEGFLGCPKCDSRYPIVDGVVHLAAPEPPATGAAASESGMLPEGAAMVVAAVLGLAGGKGRVLLGVGLAAIAEEVASLAPTWDVVSLAAAPASAAAIDNLSRIVVSGAAPPPVLKGRFAAVAVAGHLAADRLGSYAGAVSPLGRMAVLAPGPGIAEVLHGGGLELLAADDRVAVASRRA